MLMMGIVNMLITGYSYLKDKTVYNANIICNKY